MDGTARTGHELSNGIKVTDAEMAALNITRADFHGEWNYTFSPIARQPDVVVS